MAAIKGQMPSCRGLRPCRLALGIRHLSPRRLDHLSDVFGHRHVLQLIGQFGAGAI